MLCFCLVFRRLVYTMLPVSLDCPFLIVLSVLFLIVLSVLFLIALLVLFLIALSVFSNVY